MLNKTKKLLLIILMISLISVGVYGLTTGVRGWLISHLSDSSSSYTGTRSIVRNDNFTFYAVWTAHNGAIACSESNDDGATWTTAVLTSNTNPMLYPTLATNGSRLMVVGLQSADGDLAWAYSDSGCSGFSGDATIDITGLTTAVGASSMAYNQITNQWVMCLEYSGADVGFANISVTATNYSNWQVLEVADTRNIGAGCSIAVDTSGNVFFTTADASNNDLDLFNSSGTNLRTWTERLIADWNPQTVDININGKYQGIVSQRNADNDLYYFYTNNNWTSWVETEQNYTDGENVLNPVLCIDSEGAGWITYQLPTSFLIHTKYVNGNWISATQVDDSAQASHISARCTTFPSSNRFDDGVADVVFNMEYNATSNDIRYGYVYAVGYTICIGASCTIPCYNNYTLNRIFTQSSPNVNITFNGSGTTILDRDITNYSYYNIINGCTVICGKGCIKDV